MTMDIPAYIPKTKWVILNPEEANKRKLKLLSIDDETTLLSIDIAYIPSGMTISEYLDMIQKYGIVIQFTPGAKPVEFKKNAQ